MILIITFDRFWCELYQFPFVILSTNNTLCACVTAHLVTQTASLSCSCVCTFVATSTFYLAYFVFWAFRGRSTTAAQNGKLCWGDFCHWLWLGSLELGEGMGGNSRAGGGLAAMFRWKKVRRMFAAWFSGCAKAPNISRERDRVRERGRRERERERLAEFVAGSKTI